MSILLKLFKTTFARVPQIQNLVPKLYTNLREIDDLFTLEQRAKLLFLSHQIMKQAAEIQKEKPIEVINRFKEHYDEIKYDYEDSCFNLQKIRGEKEIKCKVKSNFVEHFDHPFFRQTLYFHEMKNAEKYLDLEMPKIFPKFMNDFYRKTIMDESLDRKNPLGIPHWAEPLCISVQMTKDETICGFELLTKLGKTLIVSTYSKKGNHIYSNNPYKLDDKVYKVLLQFLEKSAGINGTELEQMKKLAFIGGSVNRLELMMDIFDQLSAQQIQQ